MLGGTTGGRGSSGLVVGNRFDGVGIGARPLDTGTGKGWRSFLGGVGCIVGGGGC